MFFYFLSHIMYPRIVINALNALLFIYMATTFSFDVTSDFDKAEMNNVLDQANREIDSRYDFKNIFSYSDLYKSTSSTTLWRRYDDPT